MERKRACCSVSSDDVKKFMTAVRDGASVKFQSHRTPTETNVPPDTVQQPVVDHLPAANRVQFLQAYDRLCIAFFHEVLNQVEDDVLEAAMVDVFGREFPSSTEGAADALMQLFLSSASVAGPPGEKTIQFLWLMRLVWAGELFCALVEERMEQDPVVGDSVVPVVAACLSYLVTVSALSPKMERLQVELLPWRLYELLFSGNKHRSYGTNAAGRRQRLCLSECVRMVPTGCCTEYPSQHTHRAQLLWEICVHFVTSRSSKRRTRNSGWLTQCQQQEQEQQQQQDDDDDDDDDENHHPHRLLYAFLLDVPFPMLLQLLSSVVTLGCPVPDHDTIVSSVAELLDHRPELHPASVPTPLLSYLFSNCPAALHREHVYRLVSTLLLQSPPLCLCGQPAKTTATTEPGAVTELLPLYRFAVVQFGSDSPCSLFVRSLLCSHERRPHALPNLLPTADLRLFLHCLTDSIATATAEAAPLLSPYLRHVLGESSSLFQSMILLDDVLLPLFQHSPLSSLTVLFQRWKSKLQWETSSVKSCCKSIAALLVRRMTMWSSSEQDEDPEQQEVARSGVDDFLLEMFTGTPVESLVPIFLQLEHKSLMGFSFLVQRVCQGVDSCIHTVATLLVWMVEHRPDILKDNSAAVLQVCKLIPAQLLRTITSQLTEVKVKNANLWLRIIGDLSLHRGALLFFLHERNEVMHLLITLLEEPCYFSNGITLNANAAISVILEELVQANKVKPAILQLLAPLPAKSVQLFRAYQQLSTVERKSLRVEFLDNALDVLSILCAYPPLQPLTTRHTTRIFSSCLVVIQSEDSSIFHPDSVAVSFLFRIATGVFNPAQRQKFSELLLHKLKLLPTDRQAAVIGQCADELQQFVPECVGLACQPQWESMLQLTRQQ